MPVGKDRWDRTRELQAVLSRAAVLGDGRTINGADIRSALPRVPAVEGSVDERLLALVGSAGEVTMGQVMAALRVPRTTAWRAMAALVETGKVETVGETKGRRYRAAGAKATMEPVDPRWERVIACVAREGWVTRQRLVELLGVAERTAGRLLESMVAKGVLARRGAGRSTSYGIGGRGLA